MLYHRVKKLFSRKFSRIGETALLLASFTFLSQFLGLFRDRLLAGRIGVGRMLDIYYASFRVPDLIFVLGTSLVSVSILMPFLQKKLQKGKEEARDFLTRIFSAFLFIILILNTIVFIFLPYVLPKVFPGFSFEDISLVTKFSRIMLLSPLLFGISNIFSTVIQGIQRFFVYAIGPVLYNLGIISGILFFYPLFGFQGIIFGILLGIGIFLILQYSILRIEGLSPSFDLFKVRWDEIWKIVSHSLPRTFTLSSSKILFLIFTSIASTFTLGSVSIFQLSFNLQSVPIALIGISYSVAAFPVLVSLYQKKDLVRFSQQIVFPMRQIIFWSLPVMALFIVLRAYIVRVILGSGNFQWSDTRLTAASLAIFVLAILPQGINYLFLRAYYAIGKTWKPFFLSILSLFFTAFSLKFFLFLFQHEYFFRAFLEKILDIQNLQGTEILIIPLSYSVGIFALTIFFFLSLRKDFPYVKKMILESNIRKTFLQSFVSSIFLAFFTYFFLDFFGRYFNDTKTISLFFHALVSGIISLVFWYFLLKVMKNQDILFLEKLIKKVISSFPSLIKKRKIIGEIPNDSV